MWREEGGLIEETGWERVKRRGGCVLAGDCVVFGGFGGEMPTK